MKSKIISGLTILFIVAFCTGNLLAQGRINTIAGTGGMAYFGDGVPATSAQFLNPIGVATDTFDNVYVVDCNSQCIRKISAATGIITTIAGIPGSSGSTGDGGPAISARFNQPHLIFVDKPGNIYICDGGNSRVRKINASTGIISRIAGNATLGGFSGDGGPASVANLQNPEGVWVDDAGNIYISDQGNHRIRKIDAATGIINTIAGSGFGGSFYGDGGPATAAGLSLPSGIAVDGAGNVFFADAGNNRIRKIDGVTGIISTYAGGTGSGGCGGAGGPATGASFSSPGGLWVDDTGNVFMSQLNTVFKIDKATGIINNYVALCSSGGFGGDGGPAIAANMLFPYGICLDKHNNMYVADMNNYRVRKVGGYISSFAGGAVQSMAICGTAGTTSINSQMAIEDGHTGLTETWTIVTAPLNGTLSGFPASMTSGAGVTTPSGLTYTPTVGFTGPDSFQIQISNGYDSMITKVVISIDGAPVSGPLTGASTLCVGAILMIAAPSADGVWTSTTGITSVFYGIVNGLSAGTDDIKYTVTNACGTSVTTKPVTVNPVPSTVTGDENVCQGSTLPLVCTTGGGVWSSGSPAIATVDAGTGLVTALAEGSALITYMLPGGCFRTKWIIVDALAPITGTVYSFCQAATTTLMNVNFGGTWTSSNTAIATVDPVTGIVSGISPGTATISYTMSSSCFVTAGVTVNPIPPVIGGSATLCTGRTTPLSNSLAGGTWSSSNTARATISTTGMITGMGAGTAVIYYTIPTTCYNYLVVTVNTSPATITGSTNVCVGSSQAYANTTTGGTWSSSATGVATINAATGLLSGIAAGNTTISYTVSNGCYSDELCSVIDCSSTQVPGRDNEAGAVLYPNPVADVLQIRYAGKITHMAIMNYSGQKIWEVNSDVPGRTIDTKSLAPGFYYLIINGSDKYKFVKL